MERPHHSDPIRPVRTLSLVMAREVQILQTCRHADMQRWVLGAPCVLLPADLYLILAWVGGGGAGLPQAVAASGGRSSSRSGGTWPFLLQADVRRSAAVGALTSKQLRHRLVRVLEARNFVDQRAVTASLHFDSSFSEGCYHLNKIFTWCASMGSTESPCEGWIGLAKYLWHSRQGRASNFSHVSRMHACAAGAKGTGEAAEFIDTVAQDLWQRRDKRGAKASLATCLAIQRDRPGWLEIAANAPSGAAPAVASVAQQKKLMSPVLLEVGVLRLLSHGLWLPQLQPRQMPSPAALYFGFIKC